MPLFFIPPYDLSITLKELPKRHLIINLPPIIKSQWGLSLTPNLTVFEFIDGTRRKITLNEIKDYPLDFGIQKELKKIYWPLESQDMVKLIVKVIDQEDKPIVSYKIELWNNNLSYKIQETITDYRGIAELIIYRGRYWITFATMPFIRIKYRVVPLA